MPRGDRRGPEGFGPMSGRGYGYCAGYDAPGYAAPAPGRGMGRGGRGRAWGYGGGYGPGFGRGMAWRRGWGYGEYGGPGPWGPEPWSAGAGASGYEPPDPDRRQELEALKRQAEYFERGLEQVKSRIDELENDSDEE